MKDHVSFKDPLQFMSEYNALDPNVGAHSNNSFIGFNHNFKAPEHKKVLNPSLGENLEKQTEREEERGDEKLKGETTVSN